MPCPRAFGPYTVYTPLKDVSLLLIRVACSYSLKESFELSIIPAREPSSKIRVCPGGFDEPRAAARLSADCLSSIFIPLRVFMSLGREPCLVGSDSSQTSFHRATYRATCGARRVLALVGARILLDNTFGRRPSAEASSSLSTTSRSRVAELCCDMAATTLL